MAVALTGLLAVGLVVDAHGPRWGVAAGLFLVGLGVGIWDVSMNLEGADVERHLGTSVMPHFHAAFSGGTVVSALVGVGDVARRRAARPCTSPVPPSSPSSLAWWALPRFLPRSTEQPARPHAPPGSGTARPGSSRAPCSSASSSSRPPSPRAPPTTGSPSRSSRATTLEQWVGVLAFATFLTFMTLGRIVGTGLLDRYGRVPVLRVSFALAAVGAAMVI